MPFAGWTNSKFQTLHFLAGACHTPIEAHRVILQNLHAKLDAVDHQESLHKKTVAEIVTDPMVSERTKFYFTQLIDEIAFLQDCLKQLEAQIGFIPTVDDYQSNSRREWLEEFKFRVENHLLSGGPVPHTELAVMRTHPDFAQIAAHTKAVAAAIASDSTDSFLLLPKESPVAKLLGAPDVCDSTE